MAERPKETNGLKIIIITVISIAVVFSVIFIAFSYYYSHVPFSPVNHSFVETSEYNASDNYTLILSSQQGTIVMVPNNQGIIKVTVESWAYFFTSPASNITAEVSNNTYSFTVTSPQAVFRSSTISVYAPTNLIAKSFNLSTLNGAIDFNFQSTVDSLSLETINGAVTINSEVVGNLSAATQNGAIETSIIQARNISLNSQNGAITVKVTDPITSGTQNIMTVNGAITVQINPLSKLSVSAFVTNGAVTTSGLNFITSVIGSDRLIGTLNGGGGMMSVVTVNGSISLTSI